VIAGSWQLWPITVGSRRYWPLSKSTVIGRPTSVLVRATESGIGYATSRGSGLEPGGRFVTEAFVAWTFVTGRVAGVAGFVVAGAVNGVATVGRAPGDVQVADGPGVRASTA
jgi:hypothetical protein